MTMRLRLILIIPGAAFLLALGAFEFGLRKGRETAPVAPARLDRVEDHQLVRLLLAQDLGERRFSFPEVISAVTGHRVLPADPADPVIRTMLDAIEDAATRAVALLNEEDSPLRALRRINEGSRYFGDALLTFIDAHPDLTCSVPSSAAGTFRRGGYPDLRIEHAATGRVAYLDPRLFEASHRASSQSTFCFTPNKQTSKIQDDACHLVLGISHDGYQGAWTFTRAELVDLSRLPVRLKAEFQASNRDLYPAK